MKIGAMKIGLCPAVTAIAAMLWTGLAAADEPAGSRELLAPGATGGIEMLSPDELAAASGGHSVTQSTVAQSSAATQGFEFKENGITVDRDGRIRTGGAMSTVGNSGGINNVMTNSGNNVSFQNSTVLNVYLGTGLGAGAP